MAACEEKRSYSNRLAAEAALYTARNQWLRHKRRAPAPPVRVYLCPCGRWHLTHVPLQRPIFGV